MATMDFPDTPTIGQRYTSGTVTWEWTGTTWDLLVGAGVPGPTGPTGPVGAQGNGGLVAAMFFAGT